MDFMIAVAVLFGLGAAAQWIAWRLALPSILLLLAFGFAAGPGRLGWVDPAFLLGENLFPVVSISVGIILFEGGLSLHFKEIKEHGRVVLLLVTLGALVTAVLGGLAARYLLDLPAGLAVLLGAILVVSGPTVVLPLLHHIKPKGATGPILKWEGIVIDPVGAVAALLVYEGLEVGNLRDAMPFAFGGILYTILAGVFFGVAGAVLVVTMLRRYWIPDHLHVMLALAVVVGAFTGANWIHEEAGLLAVTVLGVVLANQRYVSIEHILEFKENLRVLLISVLFLLLAARLEVSQLQALSWREFVFLAFLIVIVRPVAVAACTRGSSLSMKERMFLGWMCPRGIVAAAVASVFALGLEAHGGPDAEEASRLVPITFLVIVGTVVVYGLTAPVLARRLGLSSPNPQGVLLIGAHTWARDIASALEELGIEVAVVDTNRDNIRSARMAGITAWHGNILTQRTEEAIELNDIGNVIALTPNDDVNRLTALHFLHEFGRKGVFRLSRCDGADREHEAPPPGRVVFGPEGTNYGALAQRWRAGGRIKSTKLGDGFDLAAFEAQYGDDALILFAYSPEGRLEINARDAKLDPKAGWTLIAAVPRQARDPATG